MRAFKPYNVKLFKNLTEEFLGWGEMSSKIVIPLYQLRDPHVVPFSLRFVFPILLFCFTMASFVLMKLLRVDAKSQIDFAYSSDYFVNVESQF